MLNTSTCLVYPGMQRIEYKLPAILLPLGN